MSESKYESDILHEPFADNYIFFPIASKMVDPLYNLGLTPNNITIISTFFTFLSIYYIDINNNKLACFSYLLGYLFDCVDGRLARKYSMGSDVGMALDFVSDVISNIFLFTFLIYKNKITLQIFFLLLIFSILVSLAYGINEAITCFKENGSDNFYLKKIELLKNKQEYNILFNIYLNNIESTYKLYKFIFPTFDENKSKKWLKILKEFGPGNYCLLVSSIIYNL